MIHRDSMSVEVYRTINGAKERAKLQVVLICEREPLPSQVRAFSKWITDKFKGREMNELMFAPPTNDAIAHMLEGVCSLFFVDSDEIRVRVSDAR